MFGEGEAFIEPNCSAGRPPGVVEVPLGKYPLVPCALMVTLEGFRAWSPLGGVPFATPLLLPLLTMAGPAPSEGTAGGAEGLPFTGDIEFDLACWAGAGTPTAAEELLELTMAGCDTGFPFVAAAVAYEERLDVVPEAADGAAGEADCALTGVGTGWTVLVIR
jgi:hypothetical protein